MFFLARAAARRLDAPTPVQTRGPRQTPIKYFLFYVIIFIVTQTRGHSLACVVVVRNNINRRNSAGSARRLCLRVAAGVVSVLTQSNARRFAAASGLEGRATLRTHVGAESARRICRSAGERAVASEQRRQMHGGARWLTSSSAGRLCAHALTPRLRAVSAAALANARRRVCCRRRTSGGARWPAIRQCALALASELERSATLASTPWRRVCTPSP